MRDKFLDFLQTPFGIVLSVICVVAIIIALIKWKNGRIFICVALFVLLLVGDVYSIVNLNQYYNSKGGIFGYIREFVNPTEVKIVDGVTFDFKGIEMRLIDDTNTYRATTSTADIINVPLGGSYALLVNDMPCSFDKDNSTSDYLLTTYSYTFLDEDLQEIMTDALTIRIVFNNFNTTISLTTEGGSQACMLWNEFFYKNGFKLTLTTDKYVESDIEFGNGDVSGYKIVKFIIGEKQEFYVYKVGQSLNDVPIPNVKGYTFKGWSIDGKTSVDVINYKVIDNVTFTAMLVYTPFDGTYRVFYKGAELLTLTINNNHLISSNFVTCSITDGHFNYTYSELQYPDVVVDYSFVQYCFAEYSDATSQTRNCCFEITLADDNSLLFNFYYRDNNSRLVNSFDVEYLG